MTNFNVTVSNTTKHISRNRFLYATAAIVESKGTEIITPPIPEPPPIPDISEEIINQVNALGEPTFASLGLGGWTPVGLVQNCFEYLHVTLGVPWWTAIVIGNDEQFLKIT